MTLERLLYSLPVVIIATCFHELAHGYVSYRLGDPTPKETGRLTLNPLLLLDIIGRLCLLVFGFGWAKPVQVNPNYYKNPKRGMVLVALAGPLMNFLLAFTGCLLAGLFTKLGSNGLSFRSQTGYSLFTFGTRFAYYFTILNIGLGSFNLIPFPPLDGSKVLLSLLPERLYFKWMKYERYGQLILMAALFFGVLDRPLYFIQSNLYQWMMRISYAIFSI